MRAKKAMRQKLSNQLPRNGHREFWQAPAFLRFVGAAVSPSLFAGKLLQLGRAC